MSDQREAQNTLGIPATSRFERALGAFGLFLIVTLCLAADRLPRENSRPMERAIGYGAVVVIGAIGLVGRLIDRLSPWHRGELIRRGVRRSDPRASRAGLG